jgi:hypothetical protein
VLGRRPSSAPLTPLAVLDRSCHLVAGCGDDDGLGPHDAPASDAGTSTDSRGERFSAGATPEIIVEG